MTRPGFRGGELALWTPLCLFQLPLACFGMGLHLLLMLEEP